jgi:hypothetical protein
MRPAKDRAARINLTNKRCPAKYYHAIAAKRTGQDFKGLISFKILELSCPNVMPLILPAELRKRYY